MKTLVLIILLALTTVYSFECPLTEKYQTMVFSGKTSIHRDLNSEKHSIMMPFEHSLSYQPMVGLSFMGFKSEPSSMIDFNTKLIKVEKSQFNFEVHSPITAKWTYLGLQYLVSTREDIEFGETQIQSPIYNNQNAFHVEYELKMNPTSTTMVKSFISGLIVDSIDKKFIGLRFQKEELMQKTVRLYFSSSNQKSVVNFIKLSLIIFDKEIHGLLHTADIVQEYKVIKNTKIDIKRNNIQSLSSYITGIISFQTSITSDFSMMADITYSFTLELGPKMDGMIDHLAISFLVLEVIECGNCLQFPYVFDNMCRKECPSSSISVKSYCLLNECNGLCLPTCMDNEHYEDGHCVCDEGYNRIMGKCQKCPMYTMFNYKVGKCKSICGDHAKYDENNKKCHCQEGYYVLSDGQMKKCGKCLANQTYNSQKFMCMGQCSENEKKINDKCVCQHPYHKINGMCMKCPSDSTYNTLFGTCVCFDNMQYNMQTNICMYNVECPQNQMTSVDKCDCKPGSYRINGKCSQCPENSFFNKGTGFCQCKEGFVLSGGGCVGSNPCIRDHQIRTIDGRCVCMSGYVRNSQNKCVLANFVCPSNERKMNGICVCEVGYERSSTGLCIAIQCQSQYTFSKTQQKCIPICPSGQEYSSTYNQCVQACSQNEHWNGRQCMCNQGYQKNVYNYCVMKCGVGEVRGSNGICQCDYGFRLNFGKCQPVVCPQGHIWDPNMNRCIIKCSNANQMWMNGRCQCMTGYQYNQQGLCVPICGPNQVRILGVCQCITPYVKINGICQPNPCINGNVWDHNAQTCVPPCPVNSHWSVNQCVCNTGYVRNQFNQCVMVCPVNQILNQNGQCQCKPSYMMQNQICVPIICPVGQRYDVGLQACIPICSSPFEMWQNQVCVCIENYERYGTSCVPKCKENQERRNGICACRIGFVRNSVGVCVSPFCPAGQARNQNGICVDICTKDNEIWNPVSNTCQCKSGFVRNQNQMCIFFQCPVGQNQNNLGICVDICRRNHEIWDVNSTSCQCKDTYVRDGFGNCVKTCPSGFRTNERGQCVEICPHPGEMWKSTVGRCVCKDEYARNNLGVCMKRCIKAYQEWDKINMVCKCKDGFVRNTGTGFCQLNDCGANKDKVNGQCVCKSGFNDVNGVCQPTSPSSCNFGTVYDSVRNLCVCQAPQIWAYGMCRNIPNCPANSYYNGQDCQCLFGFMLMNGVCQQVDQEYVCPQNSTYNGISCLCNVGYYPSNGVCIQCPLGTVWNGNTCSNVPTCMTGFVFSPYFRGCVPISECGENQYWDGINCRCKSGYYWIDNKCTKCEEGTLFDGKKCVEKHLIAGICLGPYQYYLLRCVCLPGYILTKEGFCIVCPELMMWNGYQCIYMVNLARQDQPQNNQQASNTIPAVIVKKE